MIPVIHEHARVSFLGKGPEERKNWPPNAWPTPFGPMPGWWTWAESILFIRRCSRDMP